MYISVVLVKWPIDVYVSVINPIRHQDKEVTQTVCCNTCV